MEHSIPARGPALPETDERQCPYCKSKHITPAKQILAVDGMVKDEVRCEACRTVFIVVRKPGL